MSRAKVLAGLVSNKQSFPGHQIGNSRAGQPEGASYIQDRTKEPHPMNRTSLVICLAASMVATVGCASKNYVKQQTTPLINKTNELDDLTAKNSKDIKDVDARAQAGIAGRERQDRRSRAEGAGRRTDRNLGPADGRCRQRPRGRADQHRRQPRQLSRRRRDLGEVRLQQRQPDAEGPGKRSTSSRPALPRPRATSSRWKAERIRWARPTTTTISASAAPTP